jgi:hypothetical protein
MAYQDHDRFLARPGLLGCAASRVRGLADPGHASTYQGNPASLIDAEIKLGTRLRRRGLGHENS